MTRQPEGRLVREIRKLITSEGGRCFKIHGDSSPYQERGIPDLLCVYRGFFVGLEAKLEGEKADPRQRKILREIRAAGGIARVVTSVGQVRKLLREINELGG